MAAIDVATGRAGRGMLMRGCAVSFALGVAFLQTRAALPETHGVLWILTALAVASALRFAGPVPHVLRHGAWVAVAILAGYFWAAHCAQLRLSDALPADWESRDVDITGVVTGLPATHERGVRFRFRVERVDTAGAQVPEQLALSWWGRPATDGRAAGVPELHPGERWQLRVRLKRPHGTLNPHAFDYEAWLLERGIRASGVVRPGTAPTPLDRNAGGYSTIVDRVRDTIRSRMLSALDGAPYAGVIVALAIGDQRAIPPDQWQTYTRTGVNHLISISGLHVTMVSGLVFAIVNALWRRRSDWIRHLPAQKAATAAGLVAAALYTLLAGFEVPAQRTLFMLAAAACVLWFDAAAAWSTVLSAALIVVLLLDPWAVLAPGFWLSFGAVAIIMFLNMNRLSIGGWFRGWWSVQWGITLALVPVTIGLFQQASVVSPLANAFAIPVVSLAVVPAALAGILLPVDWGLYVAHGLMAACMVPLEWLAGLPHAVWEQHAPPWWAVVVAVCGALWSLMPRGFPARGAGMFAFLPLFLAAPPGVSPGDARVTVLDVGQGLAVVVQTASHVLVYDTGPAFGPETDSGQRTVVPFLRGAGLRRLDLLVVSHDDIDHTGGAVSVLQSVPVGMVLTSLFDLDPLRFRAEHYYRCQSGQRWEWDGVRFEVLHPTVASYEMTLKDNDRSCVLRISTVHGSMLIPADAEKWAEASMLANVAGQLPSDVLIAPHQGSRTSSTPAFVDAVQPSAVILPYGYRNRFGHPHADVVERYAARNIPVYRTASDGALTVDFSNGGWQIGRYRDQYRRYWHDRGTM